MFLDSSWNYSVCIRLYW